MDDIRHSIHALRQLSSDLQLGVRRIYYDSLRYSSSASAGVAAVVFCATMVARGKGLRKINPESDKVPTRRVCRNLQYDIVPTADGAPWSRAYIEMTVWTTMEV